LRPFVPLFSNSHLATLAGAFWPRFEDGRRFPARRYLFASAPGTRILVETQRPPASRAEVVLVHGLEGSSRSSYMVSMARALLRAGFTVHRLNLRNCGGTEALTPTLYHAGLTEDALAFLHDRRQRTGTPVFLVGFSLGGNIVLKLAGELREAARDLLTGVCAASTPIDLAASCRRISEPANRPYDLWFLRSLKRRILVKRRHFPHLSPACDLRSLRSLYEFDDRVTAPLCGFRDAAHYYETQSAVRFLAGIRVPSLLIQAQDDPLIPFAAFRDHRLAANRHIELIAPARGGHLGFLSQRRPRFWLDETVIGWIINKSKTSGTGPYC
jgi:hypothetical protein